VMTGVDNDSDYGQHEKTTLHPSNLTYSAITVHAHSFYHVLVYIVILWPCLDLFENKKIKMGCVVYSPNNQHIPDNFIEVLV
jgi:hypothetical protein